MSGEMNLETLNPDQILEGGDLDCGSGLILLIREKMLQTPVDGILEMRSREPTVGVDLPPWCKMVGHQYLGALSTPLFTRYFMRRLPEAEDTASSLQADKERARSFEWRLRTRITGSQKSTTYFRNFSFDTGQSASFEEKDKLPSAVEYLLGALASSLATGFATEVARANLSVDDIELSTRGQLENSLALIGDESAGEPVFSEIEVKCYASSFDDVADVRAAWERAIQRSPIAATLRRAVNIQFSLAVV